LHKNKTILTVLKIFGTKQKRHMRKFNGIPRQHFHLFLKECEWRFNTGSVGRLKKVTKGELLGVSPNLK
jgi:transposase